MVMNGSRAGKCAANKSEEQLRNINHCPRGKLWFNPETKMVSCKPPKEFFGVGPYKREVDLSRGYFIGIGSMKNTCSFINLRFSVSSTRRYS